LAAAADLDAASAHAAQLAAVLRQVWHYHLLQEIIQNDLEKISSAQDLLCI